MKDTPWLFISAVILIVGSLFLIPKEYNILFYPIGLVAFLMMIYQLFCFTFATNYQTEDQIKKYNWEKTVKRHTEMDENNKILKKYESMPDIKGRKNI